MEDFTYVIDIMGTIAFAISGVLTAYKKRLDVFGILIVATVTAVGGGTLRDVMVGRTPVSWMLNADFIYVVVIATTLGVLFIKWLKYLRKSLFFFDTIGIALYTITGVKIGLLVGLSPVICIALGTLSACFGGVIRDILCNEIPVIFRKEIYASACILGGSVYVLLNKLEVHPTLVFFFSGMTVISIRFLAVRFGLSLPSIYRRDSPDEVG